MRFVKDSFTEINSRQTFWDRQSYSQKRQKLLPFSIFRVIQSAFERSMHFWMAFYYHYNPLREGLSMHRHRELKNRFYSRVFLVTVTGYLLVNSLFQFETRLWKEKKWDEEPGQRIPFRKAFLPRCYNQVVNVWVLPFLMYWGFIVIDKDLDPKVDTKQIKIGRKYRRYLVAEYVRKEKINRMRDSRYDFLELSPRHGKCPVWENV